jgi:uncharacterized protein DUF3891
VRAVGLHDCGWPVHDERPTLNKQGLPLHVFETPLNVALEVWQAGVERVANEEPYTQLLVSLHVMGLSGFAAANVHDRREQFELNKFQQRQIEKQVELRNRLGMRTDIAMKLGLAIRTDLEEEERLRRNYLIMQTMDRISLGLCCDEAPFGKIEEIVPKLGMNAVTLNFARVGEFELGVEPWAFDEERVEIEMPYKEVPARKYEDVEEFRGIYQDAHVRRVKMVVVRGTMRG